MIIQNYGLHWKRVGIGWGRKGPGSPGVLLGRNFKVKKSPVVNFRQQAGIYILQDAFRPVYIGQTGRGNQRLWSRLRGHARGQLAERWDRFSWFGIFPVAGDKLSEKLSDDIKTTLSFVLDHLEGALIAVTEPPLNRKGPNFGDTVQFAQIDANATQAEAADDNDEEGDD